MILRLSLCFFGKISHCHKNVFFLFLLFTSKIVPLITRFTDILELLLFVSLAFGLIDWFEKIFFVGFLLIFDIVG